MKLMDISLVIKDKMIPVMSVHMTKKALKITNSWMDYPTKKRNMQKIKKRGRQKSKLQRRFIS